MAYYAGLYVTYVRLMARIWAEYRVDLVVTTVSGFMGVGSRLLFLTVIFANMRQLQGWTLPEMLLIWGMMMTTLTLANSLLDVGQQVGGYVQRGELDRLLVRPPAPLFQMVGERGINFPALGRIVFGVAAIVTAVVSLPYQLPWWTAIYIPLALVSGMLAMSCIQVILSCLSFWFVNTNSLTQTLAWMNRFGEYPVTILALPLQFLFTWVLPFALVGFYPAAYVLRGDEYRPYGWAALGIGWVLLGLTAVVFDKALEHYQGTGS